MSLKLSIEALEVIDAIARKGSFAAAAEALYRVPSALTYTVQKLESDLGVQLFDRSGHRATLTEAGAELLKEGRYLLEAAHALESRVQRIATGIETNITIAVSDLFSMSPIYDVLHQFYAQAFGTRIKLTSEVFGGCWDALTSGRADISVGAPGEAPSGAGLATKLIGQLEFSFAVAINHPLANAPEPLLNEDIKPYRSIAAADSSRNLPPRSSGILSGQDVLTVPDMESKIAAQIDALGVGYLPTQTAQKYADKNQLVIKNVNASKLAGPIYLAWHNQRKNGMGKAQQWLLKRLEQLTLEELLR